MNLCTDMSGILKGALKILVILALLITYNAFAVHGQCVPTIFCGDEAIIVTASGQNSSTAYNHWYVLVDEFSDLIVAANLTGDFSSDVNSGNSYELLALNFEIANAPSVVQTGSPIDLLGLSPSQINDGCYNDDFLTDKLCFVYEADCPTNCDDYDLVINNPYDAHAENTIISDATVLNGTTITYRAGNYIQLSPGFQTENGAEFKALIEDCESIGIE